MARFRAGLGLFAGALMVLSSAVHQLLGWKALEGALLAIPVPADLVQTLRFGWAFGGAAMLGFGCITLVIFAGALRGRAIATIPAVLIGLTYTGFGAWALVLTRDPFFLIFVVPGVLVLAAAALPSRRSVP